ncbi:helix-turn-helix domain-containing protein [Iningainema tapete]|uniref:Helix-turn-helix transcriptional regulator n=1 Tax=Iningainema tapete BLCC-T55 TaxID=2748662 RepID=A0A8J6XVL4_9CYAN|nr:helix-turn-helix transcriptional regulator [Iningainema tapete]MBD2778641.1 helix-turn-helix transcriptional regulator [Iningainema tapete BLCC-T55]
MVQIHQLFKQTMDRHGIRGKDLAPLAGISPNHLSEFRSGKTWISPEVFMAMLEGMEQLAPGARRYFCQLLANESLTERKQSMGEKLVEMIEAADDEEIDLAMLAIGKKWKNSRNYSDQASNRLAV